MLQSIKTRYRATSLIVIVCVGISGHSWSQSTHHATVRGRVVDSKGIAVPFAHVVIESLNQAAMAGMNGQYILKEVPPGAYKLTSQSVGYKTQTHSIIVKDGDDLVIDFALSEDVKNLDEVVIQGKTDITAVKEEPYAVTVVDVAPLKSQNMDVNQVLNLTSGIRIRESGGLGSDFDFSLNGFSGERVKFFVDGVPMDNFGPSLSLNNIPVNQISRIEVYKGVVPVHLGADALGGAINIVTNTSAKSFVDVAYTIGSFNTHRASLLSRYRNDSSGFMVNVNAFFNYSDNNYKVQAQLPDPETGKFGDTVTVMRFHDAYRSYMAQVEAGIINKKYADRLLVGLITSGNDKEIQTGYNMAQPIGQAYTTSQVLIPTLKYQKYGLLLKKLSLSAFGTFSVNKSIVADTSSRVYNWSGGYTVRSSPRQGEIGWNKTLFEFLDRSLVTTTNLVYEFNEKHSLALNHTLIRDSRIGKEKAEVYSEVPFKDPSLLTKNIAGMAYNVNMLGDKWKISVFGKMFLMNAVDALGSDAGDEQKTSYELEGFGAATSYFFGKEIQAKFSYENTYRLPESVEMFGDGLLLEGNPELKPEKSQNFNAGVLIRKQVQKHEFLVESNYILRLTDDLIRIQTIAITNTNKNLNSAKTNCIEAALKYSYRDLFHAEINGTYQDIVNNSRYTPAGGDNYLYKDRLPNTPFLFGNFSAGLQFKNFADIDKSILALGYTTMFVEAFYLKWPSQGSRESKYDIPRQVSHNASVSYSMNNGKYNFSFSCSNIADKPLYDNFRLQRPGREFDLKLHYYFSKE